MMASALILIADGTEEMELCVFSDHHLHPMAHPRLTPAP